MVRSEAVELLKSIKEKYIHGGDEGFDEKRKQAIDIAVFVLEQKPMTNADRIREMSDEELAELFDSIVDNGMSCHLICGNLDKCKRNNSIERICKNHYLEWLKQPALRRKNDYENKIHCTF